MHRMRIFVYDIKHQIILDGYHPDFPLFQDRVINDLMLLRHKGEFSYFLLDRIKEAVGGCRIK